MTPERLGKYEIRGTLGQGAMGLVYDGWDRLIQRRVAIKTVSIPKGDAEDAAEGTERFRREAQAAGRLQHPNIVSVYDFGETETLEYIVMEFMDGGTLKDVLDREKKLPPKRACDMMGQVLAALAYSHTRGVIHRDVKPANIMLDSNGTVKLGDFGIARLESSSMTLVGDVLGTPAYMAPEQFLGETADARSDIFAAAATLFHLLTGTRPYEGSRSSVRQKLLTATSAPSATDRAADVPPALDAVLRRAMARKPTDRFQSATEFFGAMRAALPAPPVATMHDDATLFVRTPSADDTAVKPARLLPSQPLQSTAGSRLALLAGGGLALLTAAAGGAWFFTRPAPAPVTSPPPVTQASKPPVALPKPPAKPSQAEATRAANAAAAEVACAVARAQPAVAGIAIVGFAGAGAPNDAVRRAVERASGGNAVDWTRFQNFTGPYCGALAAIHEAWHANGMILGLRNQHDDGIAAPGTLLHKGEFVMPVAGDLNFPAHLRIDDIAADGSVTHIYPRVRQAAMKRSGQNATPADPDKIVTPNGKLALGLSKLQFPVGEPFGTDVIIAVASSEKLDLSDRPNSEPDATAYLAALHAAIDVAASHRARLAAGVILVETQN